MRLLPQGAIFAGALLVVGFIGGRDASEPGRVAQDLVSHAHASCASSKETEALVVPFVGAAWLCRPDAPPRLYVTSVASPVTGSDMRLSGDLRRIEMDDARLRLGPANVHVRLLTVRGLPAWGHAQSLPPLGRGALLAVCALLSAMLAVVFVLMRMGRSRLGALLIGVSGALSVLGTMRLLDRGDAKPLFYLLLVAASALATSAVAFLVSRLLGRRRSVRV